MQNDNNDTLSFKVSSGLKNLIGKELITDEYVAIFELVKNSFDANAKKVKIIFDNIYKESPKIIIMDDGKGMDFNDIENKWLFVAYSAKKDGTEEEQKDIQNYRDKISPKRYFAGAKGVGRFSCDRLGSKLNMITIKDISDSNIENISIDWTDFEKDIKKEFINIGVSHSTLTSHNYDISKGTILEITGLRDYWNREKILKLKGSLEKLINPNQQTESEDFSIEIIAREELKKDQKTKHSREKVNGIIENTVFEKLNLKTTKLETELTADGKFIITTLTDRGRLIYRITEDNTYSITNIKVHLFYLNSSAKNSFTRLMGIQPIKYGSVFMYKNGFRIYPFGEEGEDTLKLDRRKTQGYARYLGTRELIGRIEIYGENDELVETTSRDGGLVKNKSYEQLEDFFLEKALKRLEKYVVDIIKWGEPYKLKNDDIKQPALDPEDVKDNIIDIIKELSKSKRINKVEYDNDFLNIIKKSQEKSITRSFKDLSVRALAKTDDTEIHKGLEKIGTHLNELLQEKREIEKEVDKKEEEIKQVNELLEQTTSQNLFLKSVATTETKEIISLQHHINHSTVRIERNLDNLTSAIDGNAPKSELLNYIKKISLENSKISTISRFVTKANFNLTSREITNDLVQFINQYIENVYHEYKHLIINNQMLNVRIENPENLNFLYKFKPLEIIIVLDNLLNNSYKADSKNVLITWKKVSDSHLELNYKDDGKGINFNNIEKIFDFGFTTTDGSGLGLYHAKQIIEKMGGYIACVESKDGAEFIVGVKK
ncbi:sensor histidine kinase [Brevibacillus laterosporus]|uniref:sensor histidine kinase n=1 Tax=Brevibacillus laterosporus TaxID=1465 RepID=UPI0003198F1E|nr:ATP-binding protein [Brevibacillus laterosporus]